MSLPFVTPRERGTVELDAELIGEHLDRLYRYARTLTGSSHDAEDLVSDAVVRVIGRPRRVRAGDELAYLMRCVRNTWTDTLRTRGRRPATTDVPEGFEQEDALAARRPHAVAEAREVLAAVAELADDHREVIMLVDVAGLTYGEAAKTLGVPRGTVMSRLARGRSAVVNRLAPVAA